MKKFWYLLVPALYLVFLAFTPSAHASIAYVTSALGTSAAASSCAPTALSVTAGNLLVFTLKYNNNSVNPTIGDSLGNTWSVGSRSTSTLPGGGFTFYAISSFTGTDTITASGTASASTDCQVDEFSGTATTTPLDVSTTSNSGLGTGTSCASGSVTPNQNGELIFGMCVQQGASSFALTPGQGFTITSSTTRTGGQYMVQTTAASVSSTITIGTADQWVAAVLTFKAPPVVPTSTPDALFFAGD